MNPGRGGPTSYRAWDRVRLFCGHASFALQGSGYETIMSTRTRNGLDRHDTTIISFSSRSRPQTSEHLHRMKPKGLIVQFGGRRRAQPGEGAGSQRAPVVARGRFIDIAEDRQRLHELINLLDLKQPPTERPAICKGASSPPALWLSVAWFRPSLCPGAERMQSSTTNIT